MDDGSDNELKSRRRPEETRLISQVSRRKAVGKLIRYQSGVGHVALHVIHQRKIFVPLSSLTRLVELGEREDSQLTVLFLSH